MNITSNHPTALTPLANIHGKELGSQLAERLFFQNSVVSSDDILNTTTQLAQIGDTDALSSFISVWAEAYETLCGEGFSSQALLKAKDDINQKELEYKRLNHVVNDLASQFASGMSIPDFCRQLNGVNLQAVQRSLARQGLLIQDKSGYRPTSYTRNRYFECKAYEYERGKFTYSIIVTPKGAKYLYKLYMEDRLPMRRDWNGSYTPNFHTPDEK